MEYTFPFSTCEQARGHPVEQPVSVMVGVVTILLFLFFFFKAQTFESRWLIGLFLTFELLHTWSHARHVPGKIQVTLIHLIAYLIFASYFFMFSSRFGVPPMMFFIFLIVLIDIVLFIRNVPFLYYFGTLSSAFLFLFMIYGPRLPRDFQPLLLSVVISGLVIIVLIVNEKYNCKRMMEWKILPYHALVEVVACFLFCVICVFILKMEKIKKQYNMNLFSFTFERRHKKGNVPWVE